MTKPVRIQAPLEPAPSLPPGDDSRRSFLRMVSHELRTPLNAIIGFSEILSHELCGPLGAAQYKEYAGLIGDSGHKLLRLVNQVLEIVRLETGAEEMDLQPEPLEPVIREAFAQVRQQAEAARVRVAIQRPGALPLVVADARALRSALVNLLQNAVAHAPAGSMVLVRARAEGGWARIEVQDQGEGVKPEDIPRLMRPFEQGGQALTRRTDGAGLGLPITQLLCRAMGGGLELRSPAGGGLIACISLSAA